MSTVEFLSVASASILRCCRTNFAQYLFRREDCLWQQAGSWWVGVNQKKDWCSQVWADDIFSHLSGRREFWKTSVCLFLLLMLLLFLTCHWTAIPPDQTSSFIFLFYFKRKIKKFFPIGVFSDKSYGNALTPLQKRMLENKNEWNFPSISQVVHGLQLLGKSSTQSDCFLPPKDKEGVLQLLMNVALVTLTGAGHHSFEQRS